MSESQLRLLNRTRELSFFLILSGLVVAFFASRMFGDNADWQIALALAALTIGIPHGAVDHLLSVPKFFSLRMAIFLFGYLLVAGMAAWFILLWPLLGFQLIVLISALHFGVGDASFYMELTGRLRKPGFPRIVYALAAGCTPVLIPLTNSQTKAALQNVNPKLIDWAGPFAKQIFILCIALNLATAALLAIKKFYWPTLDLLLLLALSLITPPLVAFALYFGFWHAFRHTTRLTLEYRPALQLHVPDQPWRSFWKVVRAGLPAVMVVLIFTAWLKFTNGTSTSEDFLWYLLVVTWALTVPHMALTAKSDAVALKLKPSRIREST
ncbi:MAG: Brp/Blh family beta-carotene 15,15'-dioxygenase [Actinomycetales bacterium]|nr:Brp/Blh family beta-carotene 15,15'-dioxygenase [Actinomycetales bacterium]